MLLGWGMVGMVHMAPKNLPTLGGFALQQLSRCAVRRVLHHALPAPVLAQHIGLSLARRSGGGATTRPTRPCGVSMGVPLVLIHFERWDFP